MAGRVQGYAIWTGGDFSGPAEADTFTCSHCQRVVFIKPRAPASESGGWCGRCDALICGRCADKGVCTPWEKQLERIEAKAEQDRMLMAMGIG